MERTGCSFLAGGGEGGGGFGRRCAAGAAGGRLEKAAGMYEFTVAGQLQSGERVSCRAMVEVREGHFATENLTVKKQFVEPNPEQEARAAAELKPLREVYDRVTPKRLWEGPFRLPLEGDFKGSNFGKRRVLN